VDEAFIGRQGELAVLEATVDEVRRGSPRVVLVEGLAGIGKTALLRRFLAGAEDLHRISASGEEVEAGLSFGVTEQLLRAGRKALPSGVAPEPAHPGRASDPLAVGAVLVDLLGLAQHAGPVAVVLDDAHWADLPSLQALVFALRRLQADRVLALIAVREEELHRLPEGLLRLVGGERGIRLRLGGLDARQLQELASAVGVGELSLAAAERLRTHTAGNPLHARALFEELPVRVLREGALPLPAPRSFALLVVGRLARCAPEGRRLAVAASVLGTQCSLAAAGRLAEVDDPLVALDQAASAGLLAEAEGPGMRAIAFVHPLVRSAVYHDLGPAERASLHARAAELAEGQEARIRHQVLAAAGEDPALAAEVAAFARAEAGRGAFSSAAAHLVSAARLHPSPGEREYLTLEALEAMLLSGDVAEAMALAGDIGGFAESPRRFYVEGLLAFLTARFGEAEKLLLRAWDHRSREDGELGARIAGHLGALCVVQARGLEAATWARRVLALSPPGALSPGYPRLDLAVGLAIAGRCEEALAEVAALPDSGTDPPGEHLDALVGRGQVLHWTDELEAAWRDLSAVVAVRRRAPFQLGLIALGLLSEVEYRRGAWDDALADAELALSLLEDAGHIWMQAPLHAFATYPLAGRGEWAAAEGHAQAAATLAQRTGDVSGLAYSCIAAALTAYARGEWGQVVSSVEPLLQLTHVPALYEPGVMPWRELYTGALVSMGRLDDAEQALAPYEALAAERGRRSSSANAARVRGRLEAARGHPEAAEAAFLEALAHGQGVSIPLDRALTELAYGAFLRRAGRRREAAAQLQAASERLSALRASPYLARCEQELAACGLRPARRRDEERARLTPQELAVARLVAQGLTNREVASQLVVSVKTVEYHLGHCYAKVGVSSRTHLALRLAREQGQTRDFPGAKREAPA
jgi:DNA-binding CsgD family transcriptional regulator